MFEIREATYLDALHVADNMRLADIAEVWALSRLGPHAALYLSMELSVNERFAAVVDDVPIAIFGAFKSTIGGYAAPWLLGTDEVARHGIKLMRYTQKYTQHLLETYSLLRNQVHAENTAAIAYLRASGFTVGESFVTATGDKACIFEMKGGYHV